MSAENFMRPGAVDLSGLAAKAKAEQQGGATTGRSTNGSANGFVINATEATFQDAVLQQSMTVPVVIDFWAEWCGPCKQLSPTLEQLAAEYGGRFVLAKIDVDANQQLAASAQVQSIPMVLGVVKGQAVPLFNGALPAEQVRQYIDALLNEAQKLGVTGQASPASPQETDAQEPAEPPQDPRLDKAYDAIERGDYAAAAAAYKELLAESPQDADAKAGLAQVELLRRTDGVDPATAKKAADADASDVASQLLVADLEFMAGRVEEAFARLIGTVRVTAGDDREQVRSRLLELFEIAGPADPRVTKARTELASALF